MCLNRVRTYRYMHTLDSQNIWRAKWLPETCINILIAHYYSCPQDYIYLEPVQCKPQVHLCNRGICDRQLTACCHLLPITAVQVITSYSSIDILLVSVHQVLKQGREELQDGTCEVKELVRHSEARRGGALPRRDLGHRLVRRPVGEPSQPSPCLRLSRVVCSPCCYAQRMGEMDIPHGPRQHGVVSLDRPPGQYVVVVVLPLHTAVHLVDVRIPAACGRISYLWFN